MNFFLLFSLVVAVSVTQAALTATQFHLSFSGDSTAMGLDYVAPLQTSCTIQYTLTASVADATTYMTVQSSSTYTAAIGYLFTAQMTGLLPAMEYSYRVTDAVGSDFSAGG